MTVTTTATTAEGLRLIGASAGSGKTYRLTEEVTCALDPAAPAPIDMEGLVGVTYTTKAQAELEARIRRVLLRGGAFERAQRLPLAYVGTVHAVGLRLLKEFALDAGLSPEVDVIPGNEGRRLLQAALERELAPSLRERIQSLALELQLNWDGRTSRCDWVTPVEDIMNLARGNRIDPDSLPRMAERSVRELCALLPPPAPDGRALEGALAAALHEAITALETVNDEQKNTADALALLRSSASDLAAGRLSWSSWARLAKVAPGKHAVSLVEPLRAAAASYEIHPEFRSQLIELTGHLFEAARIGLNSYARWKGERGLVDYVDMIDRALSILDVPEVQRELQNRLRLLVVDEFQDTSPIQLAFFMRLHALCGTSVWVGDRKQCIFEYAGADPALMEAVTDWVTQNGGRHEHLAYNYRSRRKLVEFTSSLFAAAFREHGYTPSEVVSTAKRDALPDLERLPALGLWWLEGKEHEAMAEAVARLLAAPNETPVLDRVTGQVRPMRPGDIAILIYSNAEAERLSVALQARAIPTALPRVGLLTTPEGTLVTAVLRALVDSRDTLASAEIAALTGFGGRSGDEWLTDRIRARRAELETRDEGQEQAEPAPCASEPWASELEGLRSELPVLSPAEALDRVLTVFDLPSLAAGWPDPEQRLANLDALRALARAYEERCDYQREAASVGGLLRYFEETQQVIRQRDEERATDEQHVCTSADAVVISTYHRAKGLEWPVVVLGSLGRNRKRDAFEVSPESDSDTFDPTDPLGGRWIRYWPWPLGQQRDVPLADRAENSVLGRAIAEREGRERARLLYVGFTRARDHLILGLHLLKKGPSKAWLDELRDERGPLLGLPKPGAPDPVVTVRGLGGERLEVPVRAWSVEAGEPADAQASDEVERFWFARSPAPPPPAGQPDVPSYRIAPSRAITAAIALPEARVIATERFTRRMSFARVTGAGWDDVGNALHAFLAADVPELTAAERGELASRILTSAHLDASFTADSLLSASDALRSFVNTRWPHATWHRETPIAAVLGTDWGARRIAGTIDLLLETPAGYVIIDHKSFPGRADQWAERALEYAPQLMTYAKAIEMAGRTVIGKFIHFTIGGGIVEVGDA